MGVDYESRAIGSVRAVSINGRKGFAAAELGFVLAWSLFAKRGDACTVFGTSIWVSVMAEGEEAAAPLGQAVPETAWCEESRDGQPVDRHVTYRLTLPGAQLLALEEMRQGRGLVFTLDVRGNSYGSHGVRTFEEQLRMSVNVSDWARVLKEAGAADVLIVGVHLPVDGTDRHGRAALDLVRRAHEHLVFGHYTAAVAECRRAVESLWRSANLTDRARDARKLLSNMNGQLSMSKLDRELALGEALRIFCHVAHHVGADAQPEIFGRLDAALAVSTTAALVSSLVATPDLLESNRAIESAASMEISSPAPPASSSKEQGGSSLAAQAAKVREHLRNNPKNRPGTLKRLRSALDSLFGKKLGTQELDQLIEELMKRGVIAQKAGKLAYTEPKK